jgi:hypothetical protein
MNNDQDNELYNQMALNNLTSDELKEFFKTLEFHIKNRTTPAPPPLECKDFCAGEFQNVFTSYNSMHGYISIVVS